MVTTPGFRYVPGTRTPKVECEVCGARGYDGGRWQDNCLKGHPFECGECGRRFSTSHGCANHVRLSKDHHGQESRLF